MTVTAEDLVRSNVELCLSALVATLAQAAGGFDSVTGGAERGVRPLRELTEKAAELCAPVLDYEEAARQAGWTFEAARFTGAPWFVHAATDRRESFDGWEDLCDCEGIAPYEWEVFEHWAVSSWFAEQLIAEGERVDTDFEGLNVWARTCTGQGIAADSVMQRIHAKLVRNDD